MKLIAALLGLLLALPSHAAVTYISSNGPSGNEGSTGGNISITMPGANHTMLCLASARTFMGTDVSLNLSYNGDSFTLINEIDHAQANLWTAAYILLVADNTSTDVVWSYVGAVAPEVGNAIKCALFTGVDISGSIANAQDGTAVLSSNTGVTVTNTNVTTNCTDTLLVGVTSGTGSAYVAEHSETTFFNGDIVGGGGTDVSAMGYLAAATAGTRSYGFSTAGNESFQQIVVPLKAAGASCSGPVPAISSVTPDTFEDTDTGIVIEGSTFEASQGTGTVVICPTDDIMDGDCEAQTVTAWADDEITFTAVIGANMEDVTSYLFVTNDTGDSNADGFEVEFSSGAPSGGTANLVSGKFGMKLKGKMQ